MKLFGYTRVSTEKQLEGGGLQIQHEAITNYCKVYNHNIVRWYTDKGISAIKQRPSYNKMLKEINEADGIIVNDLTRFGRSTLDLLSQITQLDSKEKTFISVKENIDLSTKTGRLLLTLLSAIAEFERETINERMISGREYAKEHGTKSGKPMHRPQVNIDWKEVDDLLSKGLSLGAIAKVVGVTKATMYNRYKKRG